MAVTVSHLWHAADGIMSRWQHPDRKILANMLISRSRPPTIAWHYLCEGRAAMRARINEHKPAPTKMVHFLSEVLLDLPVRGRVVSVEVEDASYLVTLALHDQGQRVHQLSAWDVSRSMRGDPTALAAIRADFLRESGGGAWPEKASDAATR